MREPVKKWLSLAASIAMQSSLGGVYAWSTFTPALEREHGIHSGYSGLIFGICIATFTISMVFGGILQKKHGPRRVGMAGGLLFLAGYLVGTYSGGSLPLMITGFGLLVGAGIGLAYVCPLATVVQWFSKSKGTITGITVAGFGFGGVFIAEAGQYMLNRGLPVLDVLANLGWVVGVILIVSASLLFVPSASGEEDLAVHIPIGRILKQKEFHALFLMMFCGTFGGLLVVGNLKPIGISNGLTAAQSTIAVTLFAVGNATGRILWGVFYDKLGVRVIFWSMLLLAFGALCLGWSGSMISFYLSSLLVAFAFGGFFVIFAAQVTDVFGVGRISDIYPFIFLGYGIAGLAGPPIGGEMLHLTGTSAYATAFAVVVALIGAMIFKLYKTNISQGAHESYSR